jgi:hypothetical protein
MFISAGSMNGFTPTELVEVKKNQQTPQTHDDPIFLDP